MAVPVAELTGETRALFSDLDGTLTTDGRLESETLQTLETLEKAGIAVVIVTGRPAGWGQALAYLGAASAVVTENGGVTFVRRNGAWEKLYGLPAASVPEWRRKMHAAAVDCMANVGARLSTDSAYREVDLAIDWNEETSIPVEDADRIVEELGAQGFRASRSSVHVNFSPPLFDKLSACKVVVEHVLGGRPDQLDDYVFIGDALNDAPMFGGFSRSVGVANVRKWWDALPSKPAYITEASEGAGFRELAEHLLRQR